MSDKTLIVITGPTGCGKTDVSIKLAKHFGNIPILNADSRQIFKELKIGTAAPTKEQLKEIKHYFVGTKSVKDYYSAAVFEEEALKMLHYIFEEEKQDYAILAGGSMMYIDAVCKGIDNIPTINSQTREFMKQKLEQQGIETLLNELKMLDPDYYKIVDKRNVRRVVHALEICYMTGKTYTSFRTNTIKQRPFKIIKIALTRDRAELYERINARTHKMIEKGFIDEALKVYKYKHLNSLNTVGYKELFEYLDGLCTLDNAIFRIQSNTREYARKQLTWYKKDQTIAWFNPDNVQEIIEYISNYN